MKTLLSYFQSWVWVAVHGAYLWTPSLLVVHPANYYPLPQAVTRAMQIVETVEVAQ